MGLVKSFQEFILRLFSGTEAGNNLASTAQKVLEFTSTDGDMVEGVVTYITGPVGFVIMAIAFLTTFINNYKNGKEPSIDDFARPAFFLIIADVVLTNIGPIITTLMSLSNTGGAYAVTKIAETIDDAGASIDGFNLDGLSIIAMIVMIVPAILSYLLSIIASAMLIVVLVSAKVELLLRFAFSPIGLAFIADESRKDDTFRYFKKLVASAFYLIGIVAALYYASKIMPSIVTNLKVTTEGGSDTNMLTLALTKLEAALMQTIMPFAAIGMVSTAKNIVNESFGV